MSLKIWIADKGSSLAPQSIQEVRVAHSWQLWFLIALSKWMALLGVVPDAMAQSPPPPGVELPPKAPDAVEQIQPTPAESIPPFPEKPLNEPEPELKTAPDASIPENPSSTTPQTLFFVRQIDVLGSTVLESEIAEIAQPYENREVSLSDLIELRSAITQLYVENGYTTSGAFIPNNQDLSGGVVQVQVVEGKLEKVEITGLKRLRKSYVRDRITVATKAPLNQNRLEDALKLLQLEPLIESINAELTAGSSPGQNVLLVDVKQAPAFSSSVSFDNYRAPSIGTLQGSLEVAHGNVLGFGDRFRGEYNITEGLDLYDVGYTVPFNARNGTLGIRYSNSDSEIISAAFRDLDIRSESETLSFSLRQPIIRKPETEVALGLSFDARRSQTFLLEDLPFSFSPGPDEGESKVRALRFSQDWIDRRTQRILAARSQFSFGLDIFDATVNETGPSAAFFSWLGQFQWVQQLSSRNLMITQFSAQLTPDSLLPLERFSIGGIDTVRGYAQNQLLADNGILASVEFLLPLTKKRDRLQLNPFIEAGTVWNNSEANPTPSTLASVGLGVRWKIYQGLNARLDFGLPLINVDNQGNSLQEAGVYFSLQYIPPGF